MVKLYDGGVYLIHKTELAQDETCAGMLAGTKVCKEEARKGYDRIFRSESA